MQLAVGFVIVILRRFITVSATAKDPSTPIVVSVLVVVVAGWHRFRVAFGNAKSRQQRGLVAACLVAFIQGKIPVPESSIIVVGIVIVATTRGCINDC